MNPILYLIIYRKSRLSDIREIFINNEIDKLTYLPVKTKAISKLLNYLGLGDLDEELLISITTKDKLAKIYSEKKFDQELISNIIPLELSRIIGIKEFSNYYKSGDEMQKVIFIIVDRGQADKVISLTNSLGASGATIINARGAGIFLEQKFDMEIEPEKEIILIVTNNNTEINIAKELNDKLELNKPNKGILFTMPIAEAFGIKKTKK